MKPSKYYENLFPFEPLLKEVTDNFIKEIEVIVRNCDYTEYNDFISKKENLPLINIADAITFFEMGYEYALNEISKKLKPIELCKVN